VRRSLMLLGALALTIPVAAPAPGSQAAPPTPEGVVSGFTETTITTVSGLTTIEALPGGGLIVLQQGGTARVIRNDQLVAQPALQLNVCSGSERGLLGFTTGPGFVTDRQAYIYYTVSSPGSPGGCVNRVSRFTMNGDVIDRSTEVVLVDNISAINGNHNGGDLEIGADGFLYIAVGDGGGDPRGDSSTNDSAQDLSLYNGKILRVLPSNGDPAPGNPLSGAGTVVCGDRGSTSATPTTSCREIYAWGLRNPYRFAFDTNTGPERFFINDVGQFTREEVNLGARGANYGWPQREGVCPRNGNPPCAGPPPGLTDPINDYGRTYGTYITAGAFVPNGVWPKAYDGGYLFADGGSGEVWLRAANGAVDYDNPFITGAHGLVDMTFAESSGNTDLYYVTVGGAVRRVRANLPAPTPAPALAFSSIPPGTRVLDTREAPYGDKQIRATTTRYVQLPVDGSVTRAALVNIAYVDLVSPGFLTAWAGRTPRPLASNINAVAGEVVANAAVVPLDADGGMLVYSNATADVVIDVLGYFNAAPGAVSAGRFTALPPVRIADTRNATSTQNQYTRLSASPHPIVRVPVSGRNGMPTTGVSAVAVVVTAISGSFTSGGFVSASPDSAGFSGSSNINTNGGIDIRPNLVVVPLGPNGAIDLHLLNVQHVLVDVAGWFGTAAQPAATAGRFVSLAPTREVDTRFNIGFGRLPGGSSSSVNPAVVPNNAAAMVHNITMVDNGAAGFVTPFPGGTLPVVSAGNTTASNQVRAVLSFTQLSAAPATMSYFSNVPTDLVVDVAGYFES
jgi:glucose/arabinose dehydrogenase